MKIKLNLILLITLATIVEISLFSSCSKDNTSDNDQQTTDYSVTAHWLSIPATIHPVDVFYLYPTSWKKDTVTDPNICNIDNASMLAGSAKAYMKQATAFEPVGNVYAPYFRQADATWVFSLPVADREKDEVVGIPTKDVVAAFDYYIKHFNNGRPYILAGHSQGSNIMRYLLAGYMKENPAVYARMIAAYAIGYPVTASYMASNPHLKFATGPDDTGVIISYNTQAPDITIANPVLAGLVGFVINPITWTREQTLATKEQGLGSFMPDANGVYTQVPQCSDALIDTTLGVILANSTYAAALAASTKGIYHNYDYPFYYYNIRQNAANRIQKYLNK